MKKPNLFIIGAPKSGTTALHYYLSKHEDIFMSSLKEPCYFATDFNSPYYPKNEHEYLKLFNDVKAQKILGESTTTYLYSSKAASEIFSFNPEAKIIVMLRNPVEIIYALHGQRMFEGNETFAKFEDALDAEGDRREGRLIPNNFFYPKEYLLYREYGKYAQQLKRYFDVFTRNKIHIIIFDDFKNDTQGEFRKVCSFLEVPPIDIDFKPLNVAKSIRSLFLQRFLMNTSATRKTTKKLLKFRGYRYFCNILLSLNMKDGRKPMNENTKKMLCEYYRKEIESLSILVKRDLKHWVE